MRLISAWTLVLLVAVTHRCQAIHEVVGTEPQVTNVQQDVVVYVNNSDGSNMNLVLGCEVSGDPTPTVAWFRGGMAVDSQYVLDNGTLFVPNITEGEFARPEGVVYYCTATNTIGRPAYNATARSRDITVFYASFGGFASTDDPVFVPTASGVTIALECLVNASQPTPNIQWFVDDGTTPLVNGINIRLLEDSRFLYLRGVTSASIEYHCEVTNARIHETVSGTRYLVNGTGLTDGEYVYKEIGDRKASVGELNFVFSYIAANGEMNQVCDFHLGDNPVPQLSGIATVTMPLTTPGVYNLTCEQGGSVIGKSGTLTVYEMAAIPSLPETDREVIVGEGSESFSCTTTGTPTPTLEWFFNGQRVTDTTSGVNITGQTLSIQSPQVRHSGVYQCFASNEVSEAVASWAVEVREPMSPNPLEFNLTAIGGVRDRQVGALLVRDPGSEVSVSIMVEADPCPSVQWSFGGSDINTGNDYTITNPCTDDSNSSPFTYSLTVKNLTNATSGAYSALFKNLAGNASLPLLYITIPVNSTNPVVSVSLKVTNDSVAQCLLNASEVTITCNVNGFPRPNVMFRRGVTPITPGVDPFSHYRALFTDQFQIPDASENDQGSYMCFDGQNMSLETEFKFCTKPVLRNISAISNVFAGDELTVECEFGGIPDPTVEWEKDDAELVGDNVNIEIIRPQNPDVSRVVVNSASTANAGLYVCIGSNAAGSVKGRIRVEVNSRPFGDLSLGAIIGIAAGGAGLILLIVLFVLLLVCVYMCARSSSKGDYNMPYNVSTGKSYTDYSADPRGNVDKDSDEEDGGQPEAFSPEYESLPALRPTQPPTYKPTPSYPHGGQWSTGVWPTRSR